MRRWLKNEPHEFQPRSTSAPVGKVVYGSFEEITVGHGEIGPGPPGGTPGAWNNTALKKLSPRRRTMRSSNARCSEGAPIGMVYLQCSTCFFWERVLDDVGPEQYRERVQTISAMWL
jgi:hypothetical protein